MNRMREKRQSQEAVSIAINGRPLDKVEMLLPSLDGCTTSHILYPSHRVKLERHVGGMRMQMPAFLALELYRSGIVPQGKNQMVTLSMNGHVEGNFLIADFRYDARAGSDMVEMSLVRIGVPNEEEHPI